MLKSAIALIALLGLLPTLALAAGSEPAITEAPAAAPVAPEPVAAPSLSAPAVAKTTITAKPSVDWTKKWGDLGPGYKAAKTLIDSEQYAEGIAALQALNKPEDPRVLNWLGYSNRKLGNTDVAIQFYTQALTIAPDFTPAHEYLGEAYIQGHDMPKARNQLATIEQLCGNQTCKEYRDLRRALDKAARTRGASADLRGSSR